MRLERYAYSGAKRLRCGYTTGSCAAAAAKAATLLLFSGVMPDNVTIDTPSGVPLTLTVEQPESGDGWASCGIRKDAGDDADATDGALIRARVSARGSTEETSAANEGEIIIDGGTGVGRVTRAGLDQPAGAAAINRVPRGMIEREVRAVIASFGTSRSCETSPGMSCSCETSAGLSCSCETSPGLSRSCETLSGLSRRYETSPGLSHSCETQSGIARRCAGSLGELRGLDVVISVDGGEELAVRTYNPRLGITGGVSILGTTGIVEPMSEAALVDTIRAELNVLRAQSGGCILMTPGSYGETFARETLELPLVRSTLCSNFIGDALEYASGLGFGGILLVGHIGKLVKLAGGIYNTHSRVADGRMEILSAHAALAGADCKLIHTVMDAVTTDEAVELIKSAGLLTKVIATLLEKIEFHMRIKAGKTPVGAIVFSNVYGELGRTSGAFELENKLKNSGGNDR